jgi:hypothetical protein
MTTAEILNVLIAIVSAAATAVAILAAFRSARSAEAAQAALIEAQMSAGRRDVAQLVSSCSAEYRRIQFLARTLRVITMSLSVFNGAVGGSRQANMEAEAEKLLDETETNFKYAATFSDDPTAVSKLVPEDINRIQIELIMRLENLRGIGNVIERESTSREAQMLQHRAQAISGGR